MDGSRLVYRHDGKEEVIGTTDQFNLILDENVKKEKDFYAHTTKTCAGNCLPSVKTGICLNKG